MLEKGGAPEAKTVHHLDRCLSCLSCMTTCAVKVDYVHLIDIARAYIEDHYRRPLGERLLRRMLAELLPYPSRFALALQLARLARPFSAVLPQRLRNLVELAASRPPAGEILRPATYPATGQRKMRVALLPSCAQQALDRNINAATIRLLQRCGCEVVVAAGVGCCGALPLHIGREAQAKALAEANVAAWSEQLTERPRRHCHQCVGLRHHRKRLRTFARRRGGETDWRSGARHYRARRRAWSAGLRCRAIPGRLSRCLFVAARPAC